MGFDWAGFLTKLPAVVTGIVSIVGHVKGASHADKVDASVQAILDSASLVNYTVGKDVLNDDHIKALLTAVVDAEHAVLAARQALRDGIVNKAQA